MSYYIVVGLVCGIVSYGAVARVSYQAVFNFYTPPTSDLSLEERTEFMGRLIESRQTLRRYALKEAMIWPWAAAQYYWSRWRNPV